jgi:hypothetical protein
MIYGAVVILVYNYPAAANTEYGENQSGRFHYVVFARAAIGCPAAG